MLGKGLYNEGRLLYNYGGVQGRFFVRPGEFVVEGAALEVSASENQR